MKNEFSLSLKDQQALRNLVITEDSPGTVLRDFEALLEFARAKKPKVSGTNNLLPMDSLVELNAQLSQPLKIKLKRPLQKSYANINGLYLLLRATGLAQVERAGAKHILTIDEAVLESWKSLNATERYFTLLEAWLLRGQPEMIGERGSVFDIPGQCLRFWQHIPDEGLKVAGDRNEEYMIAFVPGLFNVALMKMFEFITLEHGEPEEGKGWRIAKVRRAPLGETLLKAALSVFASDQFWPEREGNSLPFGQLQPALQPYFPEWRNNLVLPAAEFRDGIYVFKATLGKAWRRIAIRGKEYLGDLAEIVLDAFNFDNDHLYQFSYKNRFGVEARVNHPFTEEPPLTNEVRVGDLPLRAGERMTFLFDFGDNWKFDVEMERVDKVDLKVKSPRVLEKQGKAPKQYSW